MSSALVYQRHKYLEICSEGILYRVYMYVTGNVRYRVVMVLWIRPWCCGTNGPLARHICQPGIKQVPERMQTILQLGRHMCVLVKGHLARILPRERSMCTIMCRLAIKSDDHGNQCDFYY